MTELTKEEISVKVEVLKAQLPNLQPKDLKFATDLVVKSAKYTLSEGQMKWVKILTDRAMGFGDEPPQESLGSFSKVMEMFQKAKQHLNWPKIKLQVENKPVVLTLAGEKAKCPGTVNVTDGRPFGSNIWYGRVDKDGTWTQNPALEEAQIKPVRRLLQHLAKDAADVAGTYGKLTGNCCFCSIELTDPKSTAVGFGPVCAKNYGLHDQWKNALKLKGLDE